MITVKEAPESLLTVLRGMGAPTNGPERHIHPGKYNPGYERYTQEGITRVMRGIPRVYKREYPPWYTRVCKEDTHHGIPGCVRGVTYPGIPRVCERCYLPGYTSLCV